MRIKLIKIRRYLFISLITLFTSTTMVLAKETKTITKTYDAKVGVAIENILVYDSEGQISPVINSSRNGITLKSGNINDKYGIYLTGTPSQKGTVTFNGTTNDADTYDVSYNITINITAKETKTVTKSYDVQVGVDVGNILVYDSEGQISPAINSSRNGVTLKSGTINGKYGLYLTGTPTQQGTITFTGTTNDDNMYDVDYTITINVTAKGTKTITKSYYVQVGVDVGNILVYDSEGQISPAINSSRNGVTLKSGTINGKYGLYLTGTPTQQGTITFTGSSNDADMYDITYNIIVNINAKAKEKEKKTITKTYNATVGTDIGNILVYDSDGQIYPAVNSTKNGVTLKSGTVNGKYGLHLTGTPTQQGTITFTGTTDDADTYDITYNIIVNINAKAKEKEKKTITKTYNATVGTDIGNIFVYDSDGQIYPAVNSTKNGVTLKSGTVNGKYGLHLTGTPTQQGTITFTGTTDDADTYDITYNITIKIDEKKETSTTDNSTKNDPIGTNNTDNTESNNKTDESATKDNSEDTDITSNTNNIENNDLNNKPIIQENNEIEKNNDKNESKDTNWLIIAIIVGLVLIIGIIIIFLNSKRKEIHYNDSLK